MDRPEHHHGIAVLGNIVCAKNLDRVHRKAIDGQRRGQSFTSTMAGNLTEEAFAADAQTDRAAMTL